jgi:hypothetical protein
MAKKNSIQGRGDVYGNLDISYLAQIHLRECISLLLSHDEDLMGFIFTCWKPRFRMHPKKLLREAQELDPKQRLLVQAAMDMWNGSGGVNLYEFLSGLEYEHLINFMIAICHLRGIKEDLIDALEE